MPYTFQQALLAFNNDKIRELSQDEIGLRFLKLRSLSRREHMERLLLDHGQILPNLPSNDYLRYVFDSDITDEQIEQTINSIYSEGRALRLENEDELVSELYRMAVFDWGGLHQNSLEKTIVDNYVKKIRSYDLLQEKIENELFDSMQGYVRCSWYNHWTSIIIEDVFRDHESVLPAVGLIKKIDFFIRDIPFDLKVTYIPEGFIKDKRRSYGFRPELTLLKQFCRRNNIHFNDDMPESRLLEDLWAKVSDLPAQTARQLINEFKQQRLDIIQEAIENPVELICWLYENQGVRRFDASNRLFLVLADCSNFFTSWKLKRAKPLLIDKIHGHLDRSDHIGHDVDFTWDDENYTVTSDVIFVTHNLDIG